MTIAPLAHRPRRPSRLLGSAIGELKMRVGGGEHEGRELSVLSPKCTIGSAKGCTVRLAARGVRPLHCWIIRGAGGTVVRACNPRTRLNGRPFTAAALAPGDRLQIGSVELEVLSCPTVPVEWTLHRPDLPEHPPSAEIDTLGSDAAREKSEQAAEQLRGELHNLERRAAQQLGELNDLLGRVSGERDDLAARLSHLETEAASERDKLTSRLQTLQSEAASECDALRLETQRLELSVRTSEQELAELRSQTTSREGEIESLLHIESRRVGEIQARLEQVVRERAELQTQLDRQRVSLQSDVQSHQSAVDRVQSQCDQLETELARLRERVGYAEAERNSLTSQLSEQQQRHTSLEQQLATERKESQERLDATLAQLVEARERLAGLQVAGDSQRQSEMAQVATLQERLAQMELEKSDVDGRLTAQTDAWYCERESLRQQAARVSTHAEQVEGQLKHVRELVETLAAERDSLCQQLEAAEMQLESEKQAWQTERQGLEQQLQGRPSNGTEIDVQLTDLRSRLESETARADHASRTAAETDERLAAATGQLAEAEQRIAALLSGSSNQDSQLAELQSRLESETARADHGARTAAETEQRLAAVTGQLAEAEPRIASLQSAATEQEQRLSDLQSRLESETARADDWNRTADETDQRLAAAKGQLAATEELTAAIRSEWESRLEAESSRAARCAEEADQVRQQLSTTQVSLADCETRLAAQQAQYEQRLNSERERAEAAERRSDELARDIAASDLRLTEAERRLSRFRIEGDARLNAEQHKIKEWEQKCGEAADLCENLQSQLTDYQQRCAAMEVELGALDAAQQHTRAAAANRWEQLQAQIAGHAVLMSDLRADHEARLQAQTERQAAEQQRLQEERQSLEQQLADKQRELEALQGQGGTSPDETRHSQMTVTLAELNEAQREQASPAEAPPRDEERQLWEADRKQLAERIAELERQLADPSHISQNMTLGSEFIAELQAQAADDRGQPQLADLEAQVTALRGELAEADAWQDRCREAQAATDDARSQAERLAAEVTELQARLEAQAVGATPTLLSGQLPSLDSSEQFALEQEKTALAEEREFLDAARTELARDREAFVQSQREFEAKWRQSEDELAAKERLLSTRAAELTDKLDRAVSRSAELDEERARLAAQQAELAQRLAEASAARPVPGAADAQAAPSEPSPSPIPSLLADQTPAPETRLSSVSRESTVTSEAAVRLSSVASKRAKPVWTQSDPAAAPSDDDSIEAYMARLLRRVRGDAPEAAAKPMSQIAVEMAAPAREPIAPPPSTAGEAFPLANDHAADPQPLTKPEEFLPRNRPPELSMSLVAMRQVANSAARTAIVKHERKSGSQLALAQSVGAGLTLVCTCLAAFIAFSWQSFYAGLGAAVGTIATCYWTGKALGHALRAMRLRVPTGETVMVPMQSATSDPQETPEASADSSVEASDAVGRTQAEDAGQESSPSEEGNAPGEPSTPQ